MGPTLLIIGLVCIIASIIGGGLKAFGIEIPVLQSLKRQVILAVFGCILIAVYLSPYLLRRPHSPAAEPGEHPEDKRNVPAKQDTRGTQADPALVWLGFANETSVQDREAELHRNCGVDFRRVYVPPDSGNKFTDLCSHEGKTCERVCDWEGTSFSCSAVSQGGRRDGSRIALCR